MKNSVRSWGFWVCASLAMAGSTACGGEDEKPTGGDDAGDTPREDAGAVADGGTSDAGEDAGEQPAASNSWTFFVYGHGDHTLSHALIRDIAEMANADITDNIHVVVLADYDSSQVFSGTGEPFPEGSEWLHITGSGADPEVFATEPEQNLDDPAVLSAAIAKAFTTYPAERHAVILWDHGGSWKQGFGSDTQNGTVQNPTPMLPGVVAAAVKAGLSEAGITDPLDIFSFDACLMAGTEVAWEFLELTKVYIGNAEIDYGDGWDFDGFLTYLSANSGATARKLGEQESMIWDKHHRDASANDTILRSHVALDTDKLSDFGDAYAAFAENFQGSQAIGGSAGARAAYFTLPPYLNELSGPNSSPELRDVGQFLHLIAAAPGASEVKTVAQTALSALEASILGRSQGDLRDMAGQYGVHMELPLASQLTVATLNDYTDGAKTWNAQSGWDDALRSYAEADDGQAPSVSTVVEGGVDDDIGGPVYYVDFATPDLDVAEATGQLAAVNPANTDQIQLLGIIAKGAVTPSAIDDPYSIIWDTTVMTVLDSQGVAQQVAATVWEDLGSSIDGTTNIAPLLAITGLVSPSPGEQYVGVLLFQDGEAEISTLSLLDPPITFTLAEMARDYPGTTFTPLFEQITLSTGASEPAAGDAFALDSDTLAIAWAPGSAGSYAIRTEVTDVFGNVGGDVKYMTLPVVLP